MGADGNFRERLAGITASETKRVGDEKVEARFLNGIKPMLPPVPAVPDIVPRLADLLDEIECQILKFVKLPKRELAMLVALWLAETYTFEHFRYCGYLALRSATPRCGKTLLMRLLSQLANGSPSITSIPTPAVLFRSTRPVLLLDEVDKLRNADKEKYGEVLAVLNCGFEAGAVIDRCNKKTFEVESHRVYGPKVVAGIEGIADTLADRSFQIQMERSIQRMPRLNLRKMDELFIQLRAGLQGWAGQYGGQIAETYDDLPDQLDSLEDFDDRFQDIAEPLIVLAALADSERPDGPAILPRLMNGLQAAAKRREPSGRERELLAFLEIVGPLLNGEEEVFLSSSTILDLCKDREELSRIETGRALAGFLKHFDVFPKSHSGKSRGYAIRQEWLSVWGARYGRQ